MEQRTIPQYFTRGGVKLLYRNKHSRDGIGNFMPLTQKEAFCASVLASDDENGDMDDEGERCL